jgi:sensor histidine kinase YesM
MQLTKFILSDKRNDRIKRHLAFWFLWYLYFGLSHAANPYGKPEISYFRNPVFALTESFFFLLAQVPMAYGMLYLVLPKFILKKKYVVAFVVAAVFWVFSGILHLYIGVILPKVLSYILPGQFLANTERTPGATFFMSVLAANKGTFTITAIAFVLKFAKYWYLKEQRNLQLQKENTEAQLQLLTAQVHPHFLFNTLNNIYSQTQTESPKGSKMIMELSDMLRYILSEGSKAYVPLEKELKMIRDYINLEKVRYGNKLDLHVSLPADTNDLQIAPLILLPFVENCFKHGASKFLRNPWINLKIALEDNVMFLKLMNGKDDDKKHLITISGTGIPNVQMRLNLLYPGKHDLQISNEKNVYVVNLKLELNKQEKDIKTHLEVQPSFNYA